MYWEKFTGQNIPYELQTNQRLDISVRVKVMVMIRNRIRVKVMVMVRNRVRVKVEIRVRIMAEWATKDSSKHPMVAYVWVYFKLKYTWYIFNGIFCPVYFVLPLSRYLLSDIF